MCSASSIAREDQTGRAAVRDAALGLFAEFGPDAVTIRQIAAAAGVSPALVMHHFGSKDGLRAAVNDYVAGMFDTMFAASASDSSAQQWAVPQASSSIAEMLLSAVPPGSPLPAYLRRLLLSGDAAGRALFRRWFDQSRLMIVAMEKAGVLRRSADPEVRAAILMCNDLALILLQEQLHNALGIDPLTPEGLSRWLPEALAVYREGVFADIPQEE